MTIKDQIIQNPVTWKDWITIVLFALTISTFLVQGGAILEQQRQTKTLVKDMSLELRNMQSEVHRLSVDQALLKGRDNLHDEQIRALGKEVDYLKRKQ